MNKKLLFPLSLILVIMLYFSVLEPTTVNADEVESTTLKVIKVLVPATDTGQFTLCINDNGVNLACTTDPIGDQGQLGPIDLPAGTYNIVDTAYDLNTDLDDYITEIDGDCDVYGNVSLEVGSEKTCTITSTRKVITSGYKWIDITPDGDWDLANEPPMPGWTIELFDVSTGSLASIASDVTDGTGSYEFTRLLPGKTYAVCERLDFNYIQTFPDDLTPDPDGEQIFDCTILGQNYGPYGYQFTAIPGGEYLMNNFANVEPLPLGCTYSEGYWKTHSTYGPASKPDDGWYTPIGPYAPGTDGPDADLLGSGMTWYETFRSPVKAGNAWYILAHQFMAAYLNYYNGSGAGGTDVVQWLTDGADLLDLYDGDGSDAPLIPKDSADHDWAINLADWLEKYNSGYWGPGSCDNE